MKNSENDKHCTQGKTCVYHFFFLHIKGTFVISLYLQNATFPYGKPEDCSRAKKKKKSFGKETYFLIPCGHKCIEREDGLIAK